MLKPSSRTNWENIERDLGECWECVQNNSPTAFGDLGRSRSQTTVKRTLQRVQSGLLSVVDVIDQIDRKVALNGFYTACTMLTMITSKFKLTTF